MSTEDDLPQLDALDKQISAARRASQPESAKADDERGKSVALRSGTELIAGVAVGGFLGYYADDWLGTRPALTIFGIFLGMAGGVMNIYRAVSAESAQLDDSAQTPSPKDKHTFKD